MVSKEENGTTPMIAKRNKAQKGGDHDPNPKLVGEMGPRLDVVVVSMSVGNSGRVASGELEWLCWCAMMENRQGGLIHVGSFRSIADSGVVGY